MVVKWLKHVPNIREDVGSVPSSFKMSFFLMGYKEIHEKLQIKKSSVSTYSGREQDDVLPGAIQGLNKQSMETKKINFFHSSSS